MGDETKWKRAGRLSRLAMGKTKGTRNHPPEWKADLDPLAWWCLTEAIYDIRSSSASQHPFFEGAPAQKANGNG